MTHNKPVTVGLGNFGAEVLQSDRPVLVDFWAPWCGPCKAVAPVLDAIAKEGHKVAKVDITEEPELAEHYKVNSLPTFLVFKRGEVVNKLVGLRSKADLVKSFA